MTKNKPVKARKIHLCDDGYYLDWWPKKGQHFGGELGYFIPRGDPDALVEQAVAAAKRQSKNGWTARDLITAALASLGILSPSKRNRKIKHAL